MSADHRAAIFAAMQACYDIDELAAIAKASGMHDEDQPLDDAWREADERRRQRVRDANGAGVDGTALWWEACDAFDPDDGGNGRV